MANGLKVFLNILFTIAAVPCGILCAICLTPFVILGLLFALPAAIIEDIWGVGENNIEEQVE